MEKVAEEVTEQAAAPSDEIAASDAGAEEDKAEAGEQAASGATATAQPAAESGRPRKRRAGYRRKVCAFCADGVFHIDYKDVGRLRSFISERAKIDPRRKTGTCAKHQRRLSVALKRARYLALLPYTPEHARVSGFTSRG